MFFPALLGAAPELFPFAETWWLYLVFTAIVLVPLVFDLAVLQRQVHEISFREATIGSGLWIVFALVINYAFYLYASWSFARDPRLLAFPGFAPQAAATQASLEFLTGYVIERALSFDNIFVFVVVFRYFGIPAELQHRVLFFGIAGAYVFRTIFIAAGSLLMQFEAVIFIFGLFLIVTGARMLFVDEKPIEPEKNWIVRLCHRLLPVTPALEGRRFFVRRGAVLHATPLLIALLFLEATDVVFAVDSVPAIFAITREPLIVFTSNICAILGLRAMYFMLVNAMDEFYLLKYGLAIVLVFVGLKMVWLNRVYEGHFPILLSLVIILAVLAVSILGSMLRPRKAEGPGDPHP